MADMDNTPLKPSEQPFEALPVPAGTCKLSFLKTGTLTMPAFMFCQDYKGDMLLTDYSFLIEHPSSGRRVLFDLGLRKDLKYPSKLDKMFSIWKCTAPSSPQEILRNNGIDLESVDTVIFSHTHFDHIGDVSDLPSSTILQFGPYNDLSKMEDKQKLADSLFVNLKDVKNRQVKHLSDAEWETYGNLGGYDFFGDASLVLLDTPGHMEGHLGALVCVSTGSQGSEPLYYFLGGDAAHHINLIDYEDPTPIGVFKAKHNEISPVRETDPESLQSMDVDLQVSKKTLALMARQDHEPNINVILAHDQTLETVLKEINGGQEGDLIRLDGSKGEHLLFKNRKRKEKGEA
ncbi:hypothetical protein P389DRAFT_174556 [Cystobasidium minutum MCA 4210]|uniref:uncharacterized protein n=1 Tax=Cystobasidium minutum MCA 4210 TaxID=1397322 RepID=UPI0034CE330A|eukprot:jgi/Rhomi1/174556/fgenesh1_kg.8_\